MRFLFKNYIGYNKYLFKSEVKIKSRPDQYTFIVLKQTKITSIPLPNLTKANVYFNILQTQDSKSIDVLFCSYNYGKSNEYLFLCPEKGLERFDQTQLFEMNGTYSRVLDLSSNRFQELPNINQLDVRVLNLHSNHIKQLIDSSNLPKSIEVNKVL